MAGTKELALGAVSRALIDDSRTRRSDGSALLCSPKESIRATEDLYESYTCAVYILRILEMGRSGRIRDIHIARVPMRSFLIQDEPKLPQQSRFEKLIRNHVFWKTTSERLRCGWGQRQAELERRLERVVL